MRPSNRGRILALLVILLLAGLLAYAGYKATTYNAPESPAVTQKSLADKLKSDAGRKQSDAKKPAKPEPATKPETTKPASNPANTPSPPASTPASPPAPETPALVASGPGEVTLAIIGISLVSAAVAYAYQLRRQSSMR